MMMGMGLSSFWGELIKTGMGNSKPTGRLNLYFSVLHPMAQGLKSPRGP
jgi:hypothetical protein